MAESRHLTPQPILAPYGNAISIGFVIYVMHGHIVVKFMLYTYRLCKNVVGDVFCLFVDLESRRQEYKSLVC